MSYIKATTVNERRLLRNYARWLGRLTFAIDSVVPSRELADLYGQHVNLLLTSPYMMDQILLAPENHEQFLKLSKSLLYAQTKNCAHKTKYNAAKDFFDNFDASVNECQSISEKYRKERDERERLGQPLVIEQIYHLRCPYTQRVTRIVEPNSSKSVTD